jgi:hypothetical protein
MKDLFVSSVLLNENWYPMHYTYNAHNLMNLGKHRHLCDPSPQSRYQMTLWLPECLVSVCLFGLSVIFVWLSIINIRST